VHSGHVPDAARGRFPCVVCEISRLTAEGAPDAVSGVGVAAVHDLAEQVREHLDRVGGNAVLGGLGRVLLTVGELSDRLGYRSEAAFSRAFKRIIGVSPGSVTQPLRSPANLWR
jgi:AraC-like DNA-binding protein